MRKFAEDVNRDDGTNNDVHNMWALVLAEKIRRIPAARRDRFELQVDTLARDVLDFV